MLLSPRCLLSIILLIIVAGLVYLLWPQQRVQISFEDEHCLLRESSFSLVWQHSVEHQQWRENYRLLSDALLLEANYIETFGAGTPSSGQLIEAPEGFIGFESGLRLPVIHWMVSRNMQGQIISPEGTWTIYNTVPDYTEITIKPLQTTRIFFWLGNHCYDQKYAFRDRSKQSRNP